MPTWMSVGGVVLFFLAATAFGVLEVHSSTDTWIGLAAGRQIMTSPTFPKFDTFSYTCPQPTVWLNQNWLSHVYFWLLYDRLGPNAVIYGTWLLSAAIFALVLAATWLHSRSWRAATIAAGVVAIATRDWVSPRPATIQFLCLALLSLAFIALLNQGRRRRWWPIVLVGLVFGVWTHAHGSFIFGYGLVGLFVGCWLLPRFWGDRGAVDAKQIGALVIVAAITAVLGAVLSPYGLENYTHQLKVAESDVFRGVGEWRPPYVAFKTFPNVGRFWIAVGLAALSPLVAWLLVRTDKTRTASLSHASEAPCRPDKASQRGAQRQARAAQTVAPTSVAAVRASAGAPAAAAPPEEGSGWTAQRLLFDFVAVAIGLGMALFARRFAPIFYILATPTLVAATLLLARRLSARRRVVVRDSCAMLAWGGAILMAILTTTRAQAELVVRLGEDQHWTLLDRVTRADTLAWGCIDFLRNNHLTPNVFMEWTQAGAAMLYVPGVRVFIDGRSQQVYTEAQYNAYLRFLHAQSASTVGEELAAVGTDAAALRTRTAAGLSRVLASDPRWPLFFATPDEALYVRIDSPLAMELGRRERLGDLVWPDQPDALVARGLLLVVTEPTDANGALRRWHEALARDPRAGLLCYGYIARALQQGRSTEAAAAFLAAERTRVESGQVGALSENARKALLAELKRCAAALNAKPATPARPASPPARTAPPVAPPAPAQPPPGG